mmetsp:Transcript_11944/g.35887  ORF Transcript_11944/g.35887 Transcript_11944/m.35887 type:complete len:327 (+) Transcript_11944:459-1439(+)
MSSVSLNSWSLWAGGETGMPSPARPVATSSLGSSSSSGAPGVKSKALARKLPGSFLSAAPLPPLTVALNLGETFAKATRTRAGPTDKRAPSLAWPSSWSLVAKASPAMKSETVRPTDEMTPATTRWRNVMPSGRGKPRATAREDPIVMPKVLPENKESTITIENAPASSNDTPALTAPKANRTKKSTKFLTALSKSCNGDAWWCFTLTLESKGSASPCDESPIKVTRSAKSSMAESILIGMNGTTKHSASDGWTAAYSKPNHAKGPARKTYAGHRAHSSFLNTYAITIANTTSKSQTGFSGFSASGYAKAMIIKPMPSSITAHSNK